MPKSSHLKWTNIGNTTFSLAKDLNRTNKVPISQSSPSLCQLAYSPHLALAISISSLAQSPSQTCYTAFPCENSIWWRSLSGSQLNYSSRCLSPLFLRAIVATTLLHYTLSAEAISQDVHPSPSPSLSLLLLEFFWSSESRKQRGEDLGISWSPHAELVGNHVFTKVPTASLPQ